MGPEFAGRPAGAQLWHARDAGPGQLCVADRSRGHEDVKVRQHYLTSVTRPSVSEDPMEMGRELSAGSGDPERSREGGGVMRPHPSTKNNPATLGTNPLIPRSPHQKQVFALQVGRV